MPAMVTRRTYSMKSTRCLPKCVCAFVVSVVFIVGGFVLPFIWPVILKYLIESNMVLMPTSHAFDIWRKFPTAFPIDFYFFNWTNPEDVYNSSVKMKFREMGPYRYSETKEKADIVWNKNGTVSFRHLKFWYENREKGNINDEITTVNPVALSAAYSARTWGYLIRQGLSLSLSSMSPTVHITRSVSEMLFTGYKDPLITLARSLPFLSGSLPPWDKFGWFYTRNGSAHYEGIFNMGTGINSTFGRLYSWNYWTQTPYYEGSCAMVNGSAGEFFTKLDNKSISFFSPDLCRTMTLRYSGQSVVNNILGNKYVVDSYMLDNGTIFPENRCFCNGECVPSGLVNVSSCRFGSPSFASLPHFYQADAYYTDSIEGVRPEKSKHEFFLTLEPTTGIPLEVSARLQINLLMQPDSGISLYKGVPKVFVPILWFEQKIRIPDGEAFKLRLLLNLPVICTAFGIILVFAGVIVVSLLVYKICTMNLCGKRKEKLLYADQSIPLKMDRSLEIVKKI
ncbi:protein croquemort isoform X2 [Tribolium castaneum]|nr:PREDICTED: protein croquemort isoform X2 [Tribolium castaneum]|eukprot:XP_975231.1 PREDICTED: protein croquemort isoform X2 [Tribolium castaneum]